MNSDRALLSRFVRAGDQAALGELIERHATMVYSVCLRMLGDEKAAEESAQAAFLVLTRQAKKLCRRPSPTLAGWLMHTAYLAALSARESASRAASRDRALAPVPLEHALAQSER
jgi:RNA polymerase sigma-70 factor (ECF subfamily)